MFPSVFRICLLVSVILNALAQGHGHHHDHEDGEGISDDDNIWSRYRRALAYPYNSCTGVSATTTPNWCYPYSYSMSKSRFLQVLIAIAVPLNLPHHNVFVSYNFEANYNMPTAATDISPGVFQRLQLAGVTDPSLEPEEPVADARRDRRSVAEAGLLTRAKFYRYLIRKMNGHQWNGKACLLRLICEAAANPTDEHNGVLGSLLQVVLT